MFLQPAMNKYFSSYHFLIYMPHQNSFENKIVAGKLTAYGTYSLLKSKNKLGSLGKNNFKSDGFWTKPLGVLASIYQLAEWGQQKTLF